MIRKRAIVVAAIGDTHVNSAVGINPLLVELNDGEWSPGKSGRWQWQCWLKYWDWIADLKKSHRAHLYVIANGDLIDDPYHPTTKTVVQDKSTIVDMAETVFDKPRQMADEFFVIGGTDAHAGIDHYIEELLAKRLDATPDEKSSAWDHLKIDVNGVLFDVCHHPQTSGYRPWTEQAAAARQSEIIKSHYVEMNETIPDIALRSHVHYAADSGIETRPRTFFLLPWQLTHKTTYGKRRGRSYQIQSIGGLAFVCKDSSYTVHRKSFRPEGKKPWKK